LQLASHPKRKIDKAPSSKSCIIAGFDEMEHNGFSSAIIE
jgi:pyrroline-5-carboxylate reductase